MHKYIYIHTQICWGFLFVFMVLFGFFFPKANQVYMTKVSISSISLKRSTELDSLVHGGTIHFFCQNQAENLGD